MFTVLFYFEYFFPEQTYFGGATEQQLVCQAAVDHCSRREEPFLALQLEVKGKADIMQSLQLFVDGERLQGDNAVRCDKCGCKVDTLKRVCIKRLPHTLILNLKRFEFNVATMTKTKINNRVSFPMQINMLSYTREGLAVPKTSGNCSDVPLASPTHGSPGAFPPSTESPFGSPNAGSASEWDEDETVFYLYLSHPLFFVVVVFF